MPVYTAGVSAPTPITFPGAAQGQRANGGGYWRSDYQPVAEAPAAAAQIQTPTAAVGSTFDDQPNYTSASTFAIAEAKTGVDGSTGTSGSTFSITELFGRGFVETITGTSASTSSLTEGRVAADTQAANSGSTFATVEGRLLSDPLTGTSSSSFSLNAPAGFVDAGIYVSASSFALEEIYTPSVAPPPPIVEVPSGLLALVTKRTPRVPPRPRRFVDAPVGIMQSVGQLVEVYRPPVPREPMSLQLALPPITDRDLAELVALELV